MNVQSMMLRWLFISYILIALSVLYENEESLNMQLTILVSLLLITLMNDPIYTVSLPINYEPSIHILPKPIIDTAPESFPNYPSLNEHLKISTLLTSAILSPIWMKELLSYFDLTPIN